MTRSARSLPGAPAAADQALARLLRGITASLLLLVLLAGCAGRPTYRPLPSDYAQPPRADGLFAVVEARIAQENGPEHSGFTLLDRSERALQWRLALIDSARHSIDMQYYVWFGDDVGTLLMLRVIDAADRGVKVRILFDDLNTMLHDMGHLELRDALMAHIDKHPNIQIRVFNPWEDRSLFGRAFDMAADFGRLNRRMHNKQMIVDNRVAIIGGRNLADEYFGLNPKFNFHDLDALGVGPVARQATAIFDRYWNSRWVRRIPWASSETADPLLPQVRSSALTKLEANPSLTSTFALLGNWSGRFAELPGELAVGSSSVHADSPSRDQAIRNYVPEAFRALMRSAKRELLITNAYIIPDPNFMNDLADLVRRGVEVRILTNSLASHDVPAVNSHYQKWREPILDTGAKLYELRADAELRADVVEITPNRAEFVGLHTKAMVIDRVRAFVGSMNLDPRSEILNSEMGVVIDSPMLAETLARRMDRDMHGANSWQVVLNANGELRWRSDAGELDAQPSRSALQWIENFIFRFFPSDLY